MNDNINIIKKHKIYTERQKYATHIVKTANNFCNVVQEKEREREISS